MKRSWLLAPLAATFIVSVASHAKAGICDYRLSDLVRSGSSTADKSIAAAEGAIIATSAAGLAFKAAGLYTIVNATTGAVMIGSTAAGISAAGTTGIIAGTSGALGTAGAIVTAPATAIAGAVTALGAASLEAGCYFADDRITEKSEVLAILKAVEPLQDPMRFKLEPAFRESFWNGPFTSWDLLLWNDQENQWDSFELEDLYIVNGILMHRDWFLNSELGTFSASGPP